MSRKLPRIAAAVAIRMVSTVAAQSAVSAASPPLGSVVSMFLLDTDPQPLVASYIGMSNSLTTLAINCPPGTPDDSCGYPEPFTLTANPSTVTAAAVYQGVTLNYGCTLTGTTSGSCSVTYVGAASDLATDEAGASTATGTTTITTQGALSAADITLFPITVTAGAIAQADNAAYGTAAPSSQATGQYGGAGSDADSGAVPSPATSASGSAVTSAAGGEGDSGSGSGSGDGSGNGADSNNNAGYSVNLPGVSDNSNNGGYTVNLPSGSGSGTAVSTSGLVATYSKADAYKIATPGVFGAALLGIAAFL